MPVSKLLRGQEKCNIAESKFEGARSTLDFVMAPRREGQSNDGFISVEIKKAVHAPAMLAARISFTTVSAPQSAWWFCLMSLTGALIYALIDVAAASKGRIDRMWIRMRDSQGASFLLAAAAGLVGWGMKATGVVDLKVTASDSLGYLAMGFILAMIGIEALLKKLQDKFSPRPTGA